MMSARTYDNWKTACCGNWPNCANCQAEEPEDDRNPWEYISRTEAKDFMNRIRLKTGNRDGIMSYQHVAELMDIPERRSRDLLWAAVHYGYSDRQGGAFVV